jgi:hypothetical protein
MLPLPDLHCACLKSIPSGLLFDTHFRTQKYVISSEEAMKLMPNGTVGPTKQNG